MGIELARAFVTVRGDYSGLQQDLQGAQAATEQAMKSIAAGALAILAPFSRFGKGVMSEGMRLAGTLEQTTVEMETMLGSATETQEVLARLTKFAVETPFEMPQLLSVTRGLIQFGDRGEDIFETLKILGDASGGTAEKFGLLGLVFNQIRGAGRLMRQDFLQLSMRGIISLQDIAKHYKVTTAEADKMLSSGKIKFEDFKKIMKGLTEEGGRYANMMQKQSKTLIGLTSTLSDAINITKRLIAEPLIPYVKEIVSAAILAADAVSKFVQSGGEAVSFAMLGSTAFSTLGMALYGAGAAARFFGLSWKGMMKGMMIASGIIALGAAFGYLMSKLGLPQAALAGWEWLKKKVEENWFIVENFQKAWENLSSVISIVWTNIAAAISPVTSAISGWFAGLGTSVFEFVLGAAVSISEWALDTSEWILVIVRHWREGWNLMTLLAGAVMSGLIDMCNNASAMMQNAFLKFFKYVFDSFNYLAKKMSDLRANMIALATEGRLATEEEKQKAREGLGQIDTSGMKPKEVKGGLMGMSDRTNTIVAEFQKRFKFWAEGVNTAKKDLENARKNKPFGPENDPNKGKDDKKPKEMPSEILKAGLYDIPRFGKSIQESILKNDPNAKTNGLLEHGNAVMQKVADNTEEIKKNGGLGE